MLSLIQPMVVNVTFYCARLAHPAAETWHLSSVLFISKSPPSWLQSPRKPFDFIFHLLHPSSGCSSEVDFSWEQLMDNQLSLYVKSSVELEDHWFEWDRRLMAIMAIENPSGPGGEEVDSFIWSKLHSACHAPPAVSVGYGSSLPFLEGGHILL